jgi:epoxyqueuosine reductase
MERIAPMMDQPVESALWVEDIIKTFIETSPENTLQNKNNDKAFAEPLVGFAKGDDALFDAYKDHVGPFYMTPWEVFAVTLRDLNIKAKDLTVISWVLPHTLSTKADNRKESVYPAESWARARIFGEAVNVKLRKHVVQTLEVNGFRAIAPALLPQFSMRVSPKYGLASTWSERHTAYACGLGTFGLCDGLITPVGKAMRVGSVVAQIRIPPTPRPYTDHHAYCLFFTHGTCGKCISKCPVGAITEKGKDKMICLKHLFPTTNEYVKTHFHFDGYGCGHCQTGVPCESKIPTPQDMEV